MTLLSDRISLSMGRTQSQLTTSVQRLSSGLRINTAQDDPSGLAIAESLHAQVNGLDSGSRSIQDANNALSVADGALSTISTILQRMRALVVHANSTLLSADDQGNVQKEIDSLRQEVDKIAQTTTFNGKNLLDGSLSSQFPQAAQLLIPSNGSGGATVLRVDPQFDPQLYQPAEQFQESFTINSYDPATGLVNVTSTIEGAAPFGPPQTTTRNFVDGTNVPDSGDPLFPNPPQTAGTPSIQEQDQGGIITANTVVGYNFGTITKDMVGQSAFFLSIPAQTKAPGHALEVNTGSGEGTTVTIDIPAVNSTNLAINNIQLGDTVTNTGSEYRIDYAINQLSNIRAQVGAQNVSLQESASNNAISENAIASSESNIRDANIGQEFTNFSREQLLVTVQSSLLSQVHNHATQDILALFR